MTATEHRTYCRFCHACCAMIATVKDGIPIAVRGDKDDPVYGGYTCVKGRTLADAHTQPERLRMSQKRMADGSYAEILLGDALDEIGERLMRVIDRYGPKSVAVYAGTYAFQNSAGVASAAAFAKGLGSHQFYTSVTLDQPAKVYTTMRMGSWSGGLQGFDSAGVAMFIGNNPVTSHYAPPGGLPPFSPNRRLRDALDRGLKLIVVDPRQSEVARLAELHLQVNPGEDVPLLAAMLNTILSEGRETEISSMRMSRISKISAPPSHPSRLRPWLHAADSPRKTSGARRACSRPDRAGPPRRARGRRCRDGARLPSG